MRITFYTSISMLLLVLSGATSAADLVTGYFSDLDTFHANFTQRVVDTEGQQLQQSEGEVWMQRPGRFRWDYRTPYRQLIVADGEFIWTYDEDLEQATIKTVDEALSSTPAMLLSGFKPLSEVMSSTELGETDGVLWYRLDPLQEDSAVEQVRIGFRQRQLRVIEVKDAFGNDTRISFENVEPNQPVDDQMFKLDLPPGTDIIGASP
ncbi:MAG: outer membrane lipoprotein chaperone LolA [Thiogranum sp.]|nr:outer membrane lipoprotein chaperone LolA [Thiogranum sp.]